MESTDVSIVMSQRDITNTIIGITISYVSKPNMNWVKIRIDFDRQQKSIQVWAEWLGTYLFGRFFVDSEKRSITNHGLTEEHIAYLKMLYTLMHESK